MTTLAPIAPTVAKLVRLLGSDQDHETLGAARALKRVLNSAKLDLNDLADVVESSARREAPRVETTTDNPFSRMHRASARNDVVREMLQCCRERLNLLTSKERTFVCSIAAWRAELTPRQLAWLSSIYERLEGERTS